MIGSTQQWTWTQVLINALLEALKTRPGAALLTNPTLRLATAVTAVNPTMVVGNFTEAAFTGYAGAAITLPAAPSNLGNNLQALVASALFQMTATTGGSAAVMCVYLTDDANTVVYGAEVLADQVNFVAPGDFFDYTLLLPASTILATA